MQSLLDLTLLFCLQLEGMRDLLFAALHNRSSVGLFIAQGKHNRITSLLPHGGFTGALSLFTGSMRDVMKELMQQLQHSHGSPQCGQTSIP